MVDCLFLRQQQQQRKQQQCCSCRRCRVSLPSSLMGWASSRPPPSAIFPLSPHMMGDNTDPTRAFGWSLGEGAGRQKGGIKRFGGWGGGRYGCDGNGFFINASCIQIRTILKRKNPRQKLRDAAAWTRYAPLPLHRQNCRGGICKPPILA